MQAIATQIKAYTIRDFCRVYGIGRSSTYAEIAAGRLPVRKVGRRTLILKADADAWLERLPVGTAQSPARGGAGK